MTNGETLAERIEAAGVDEQRAMLAEAYDALFPKMREDGHTVSFIKRLDADAYLDAAMMLVPGHMMINSLAEYGQGMGRLTGRFMATLVPKEAPSLMASFDERRALMAVCKDAATPALALAAAAIRAGGV